MRRSRGVLDSPLSRGMTAVSEARSVRTQETRCPEGYARSRHPTKWFAEPCTISPASFTRRYSQIFFPRSFA
ncbi:hypothetical protein GA0061098_1002236 [Bradyrhizobium shewense]|uniref:Uncharacterized protein n=1 Tax=Bradyrhizobium shewense TaxID=1761772 RepID=A0A1C3UP50_9BRAD|nr:hypothetical protein GA0061098_1002236 [Bradyrhizobium shewense]